MQGRGTAARRGGRASIRAPGWRWLAAAVTTVLVLGAGVGAIYLFDVAGVRTAACLGPGMEVAHFAAADGTGLQAAIVGRGPAAVVLAHQSDQTLCDGLPWARRLAADGFRALALGLPLRPLPNAGWDRDVEAAVGYLRHADATSVALIGASMGGAAAMVAAAAIQPPVDGVVSLSGERRVSGLDADRAVGRSTAPLLVVASESDGYLNGRDARALYAESAAADKQLRLLPGAAHGVAILEGADGTVVWNQIVAFLRAHAHRPGVEPAQGSG